MPTFVWDTFLKSSVDWREILVVPKPILVWAPTLRTVTSSMDEQGKQIRVAEQECFHYSSDVTKLPVLAVRTETPSKPFQNSKLRRSRNWHIPFPICRLVRRAQLHILRKVFRPHRLSQLRHLLLMLRTSENKKYSDKSGSVSNSFDNGTVPCVCLFSLSASPHSSGIQGRGNEGSYLHRT